jgi:N-glycosylase/DNA lyase
MMSRIRTIASIFMVNKLSKTVSFSVFLITFALRFLYGIFKSFNKLLKISPNGKTVRNRFHYDSRFV